MTTDTTDTTDAPHVAAVKQALSGTQLQVGSEAATLIANTLGEAAIQEAKSFGDAALLRLVSAAHARLAENLVQRVLPRSPVEAQTQWLAERGISLDGRRATERLRLLDHAAAQMAKRADSNANVPASPKFAPVPPVPLDALPEAARDLPAEKRLSISCTLHDAGIAKQVRRLATLEAAANNPRLSYTERDINRRGADSARMSLRSQGVPI